MPHSLTLITDLTELKNIFAAEVDQNAFLAYEKLLQNEEEKAKPIASYRRLYPNVFSIVLVIEQGVRLLRPMRYRLRPHWAEKDLASKYNLHNARIDHLESSRIWKGVFGKKHGAVLFTEFYEWAENPASQKRELAIIFPQDLKPRVAPVLYEERSGIYSFALITTDPPNDFARLDKDRFPCVLKEENIAAWLQPQDRSKEQLYPLLRDGGSTAYSHRFPKKQKLNP